MDRLHTLDAEFLYLEDAQSPMHIASICIFEGPMPSRASITQLYAAKLAQFPRYRQRVRAVPFGAGRPVWIDDPHFDLDYHLRFTALPQGGDDRALCALMGRLMAQLLDRERPLWESWFVEGIAGGRWGLISKVHHAMVDGVSGTGLLTALLDERADAPMPFTPSWRPQPEPTRAALLKQTVRELPRDARVWTKKLLGELREPMTAVRRSRDLGLGLARMAFRLRPQEAVSLHGAVGSHRSYAMTLASLEELQLIRKAYGGTLNDVVLAILADAYRAVLAHHGDDVAHSPLHTLVPVSVRRAGEQTLDNRVAALVCDLPVHLTDPVDRLHYVSQRMNELKASHMAEASTFLTEMGDLAPTFMVAGITRMIARRMHQHPQRTIATVTTHVPGPRNALYFLGQRMLHYHPYVPLAQGTRLATAILTYDGQVSFGVTADPDHVPDIDLFVRTIAEATRTLVERARTSGPQASTAPVPLDAVAGPTRQPA